jgi:hypothetical protein
LTIAIASGQLDGGTPVPAPRRPRRRLVKRVLLVVGVALFGVIATLATLVGVSLWHIDHNVFHQTASTTKVLTIPSGLGIPVAAGRTVALKSLDIHKPSVIIAGLDKIGIPISHYVGVDLHSVNPSSNLGQLASGKLSITSMISNPTGTTSLLSAVASHIYLGPGTPVSAVLSLMNVPTAHPVQVPTSRDPQGRVVLASAFTAVLRSFL